MLVREDAVRLDGYRYLPALEAGAARALNPAHYADRRDAQTPEPQPYIPSETIRADWLRVFIPYLPRRHNAALGGSALPDPVLALSRVRPVDATPFSLRGEGLRLRATGSRSLNALALRARAGARSEVAEGRMRVRGSDSAQDRKSLAALAYSAS